MWSIEPAAGIPLVALLLIGLVTVAVTRIAKPGWLRRAAQSVFLIWMILAGGFTMIAFPGSSPGMLPLATGLAVLAVGATLDLTRSGAQQPF